MATKREIKELLTRLNLKEQDMDSFWDENIGTNLLVKTLNEHGKTWKDLNISVMEKLPTQKERDKIMMEEKKCKEEEQRRLELEQQEQEKYYKENFEEIVLIKIDNGEKLTEDEIKTLVWEFKEINREYGEKGRWTRVVTSIIEIKDRTFAIDWEEGLTEYQENEYYYQPYEVKLHSYEKTIVVNEWVKYDV